MAEIKIVENDNAEQFKAEVNELLNGGFKISSSSCGFIDNEEYQYQSVFQAILIKVGHDITSSNKDYATAQRIFHEWMSIELTDKSSFWLWLEERINSTS